VNHMSESAFKGELLMNISLRELQSSSSGSDESSTNNSLDDEDEGLGGGFINSGEIEPAESSEMDLGLERLHPSKSLLSHNKAIILYEENEDIESSDSSQQGTPRARRMATANKFDKNSNFANSPKMSCCNCAAVFPTKEQEMKDNGDHHRQSYPSAAREVDEQIPRVSAPKLFTSKTTSFTIEREAQVPTTLKVKRIISKHPYINKYLVQERVGKGSFSTVRKCKDITTGHAYAMKVLNKINLQHHLRFTITEDNAVERSNALDDVWREIAIMKKLRHRNVVKLEEVINSNDVLYLIMEWMPFGSIAKSKAKICKLEREDIEHKEQDREVLRFYLRDLVSGLSYLHSQRICHSDIKPENILIGHDGVLKLADFGLSKMLLQGQSRSIFNQKDGTPAFQAPECLKESVTKFSLFPTDVWALGVTLYQLKYGRLPFFKDDEEKLVDSIINDPVQIPKTEDSDLADIIRGMLKKDPKERFTVKQLCVHPWITGRDRYPELISTYERTIVSQDEHLNAVGQHVNLHSVTGLPDGHMPGIDERGRSRTAISSPREYSSAIDSIKRCRVHPNHDPVIQKFALPEYSDSEDGDSPQQPNMKRIFSAPLKASNSTSLHKGNSPMQKGSTALPSGLRSTGPNLPSNHSVSGKSMPVTLSKLSRPSMQVGVKEEKALSKPFKDLVHGSRPSYHQLNVSAHPAVSGGDFYPRNIAGAMMKQARGLSTRGVA